MLTDTDTDAAVAATLEAGEALRAHGALNIARGDTGPITETEPLSDPWAPHNRPNRVWDFATRTGPRKFLFFTILSPLLLLAAVEGVGDGMSGRVDRLLGGVTCAGPRGSMARRMQHALSPLGGRANHMAVSDRRLVLLRRSLMGRPTRTIWTASLHDVATARPRPRGLLRRRVELRFTDGSRLVIALPAFEAPSPKKVCAALSPGGRAAGVPE